MLMLIKISRWITIPTLLLSALLLTSATSTGEELIAPTRTLGGGHEGVGRLTIFSEPPELDVFLDGSKAGQTPLWLTGVRAGKHLIRIKDAVTEVDLKSGTYLKIGLFKGHLITLPGEEEEMRGPQKVKERAKTGPSEVELPSETQREKELNRWDLFVNGTHRHF